VTAARWRLQGNSLPVREQVALWRAAARGAEADGLHDLALTRWNTARQILGLPPRKPTRKATP